MGILVMKHLRRILFFLKALRQKQYIRETFHEIIDFYKILGYKIFEMASQTKAKLRAEERCVNGGACVAVVEDLPRGSCGKVFELAKATPGRSYIVVSYNGDDRVSARLAELGFVRGARVFPLQKVLGGLRIRLDGVYAEAQPAQGSEVALGRSALKHIIVRCD